MSYEYGNSSQNFVFPNPLRRHNLFIGVATATTGIGGLALLFIARGALHLSGKGYAIAATVMAFALLTITGALLFRLFGQLRFFFGRGRPAGLAPQLGPDDLGTSPAAETVIKESLRQQALEYKEPADPIASLLYYVIPDLIYSPPPVRNFAERQFQAGILTVALLLGFLVAAILGTGGDGDGTHRSASWVALLFLLVAVPTLWNPRAGNANSDLGLSVLSAPKMAALVAFSVLGPVVIALAWRALPPAPIAIGNGTLLLLLLAASLMHGLFFAAVIRHKVPPPSTVVSMVQDTWNISVNPAMLTAEFMRAMQDGWWEKIPNRRYCRVDPAVDLQTRAGPFHGSIVEETQPIPFMLDGAGGDRPFASGDPMVIDAINAYGVVLTVIAALGAVWLVQSLAGSDGFSFGTVACLVFVAVLAKAAFDVARFLTLRFDFRSQIVWMDMNGSYTAAEVAQGNRYTGNLHSSSQVVQIEGMTFRLWATEVHSVAFGKDGRRYILSMLGQPDLLDALADRLKSFITSQAVMVSIGSSGDQERAARAGMMNAQLGQNTPPPGFFAPRIGED